MANGRNVLVAIALGAGVVGIAAFPFLASKQSRIDASKPLVGETVGRGAFVNSGSKDIGPDPKFRSTSKLPPHHQKRSPCCAAYSQQHEGLFEKLVAIVGAATISLCTLACSTPPAQAVLVSPNAGIARTVDAALRRSIPAANLNVKDMQRNLEDIAFKLRIPQRKPWQQMVDDIIRVTKIANDDAKVYVGVPAEKQAEAQRTVEAIRSGLIKIKGAIDAKDADKISVRTADVLANVGNLEIIQAPGLTFSIPKEFLNLPRLTGRATIEFLFERDEGTFIDKSGGGGKRSAKLVVAVDGYSAPITAGNFVQSILAGAYDGANLTVGGETISIASPKLQPNLLPMEMLPLGEFDPVYRTPLDVQGGELPVLPLSIYGAVAMAYTTSMDDGYVASNEFFLYKFDKSSSGLSGLSFEEGAFPVFGYVVQGGDIMEQLHTGDRITKTTVLSGQDRLLVPSAPNA